MIVVPTELEDAVWAAARAELGDPPLVAAALGRAVVDRSQRYTSDRDRLATPSDPIGDLAARATFFTVADAMKLAVPLRELINRGALTSSPAAAPLRVVDLGAGCGAMTLGLLATVTGSIDVLAIDRDARALRIASRAITAFGGARVTVETRPGDVGTLVALGSSTRGRADLVLLGTVLNELDLAARLATVEAALAAIAPDGAVVIIEPALRDTSRALHEVRDAVIARGRGHVFAPCTRTLAPCPALADARDWCHEDRAVQLPPRTRELAHRTHLRDAGLRFSYLVLRRAPLSVADSPAVRIVSAPMPDKGKLEIYGCSDAGRVVLRRLRRHRSDANRPFERADRGDILAITPPTTEIDRSTTVEFLQRRPGDRD